MPEIDSATPDTPHLLHGFDFATDGSERTLTWDEIKAGSAEPSSGRRWLHMDRNSEEVLAWLRTHSGLDRIIVSALMAGDARPRCVSHAGGVLLNLRGVNLNPGAEPEDMISVRMWITDTLIISANARRLKAIADLAADIQTNNKTETTGALATFLTQRLIYRLDPVVSDLDEQADGFEETLLEDDKQLPRTALAGFRREVIGLRRYVVPQREAINHFIREGEHLLSNDDKLTLRETADQVTRLAEDLDTIRERAVVIQEQIVERRAEEMNDRLFVLSIISAVFLPLGFFTGLFGVNVGGMPGIDSPIAFAVLCGAMLVIFGLLLLVFRRLKWI